ncbi:MAG: outer-membrane lipoprotein carrier protein [Lysobacterales bacterium]|jgi:outer membrane lipoprotein carrier protein|nr:MAG: outer-membrane lipoprotein carrier protein [Xanthomonadales bacterium]
MRACGFFLMFLAAPLMAEEGGRAPALSELHAFIDGASALRARFTQMSYDVNGQLSEQAEGDLLLARPNRMRIEYREPFAQLIIADGRELWVYDPELEQVTVRRQPEADPGSPLLALVQPDRIEEVFRIEERPGPPGSAWLRLIPRQPTEGMEYAELLLIEGSLRAMHLIDGLGQRNEYAFSNWQRDPPFSEAEFLFVVPPGVEVVRADQD